MESYWTAQRKKAIRHLDRIDVHSWFDLWHTHVDWESRGNRHEELRKRAAQLTIEAYEDLLNRVAVRSEPAQAWAQIHRDTGSNAVYLHTPNPNGTQFPCEFSNVRWGVSAPPELAHIDLSHRYELGEMKGRDESVFLVRRRSPVV